MMIISLRQKNDEGFVVEIIQGLVMLVDFVGSLDLDVVFSAAKSLAAQIPSAFADT